MRDYKILVLIALAFTPCFVALAIFCFDGNTSFTNLVKDEGQFMCGVHQREYTPSLQ